MFLLFSICFNLFNGRFIILICQTKTKFYIVACFGCEVRFTFCPLFITRILNRLFRWLLLTFLPLVAEGQFFIEIAELHFKWTFYGISLVSNQHFKSCICRQSAVSTVRLQSLDTLNETRVCYHVLLDFTLVIAQLNQNEYVYEQVSLRK